MANEVRLVPRQGFVIIRGDGQVKLMPRGGFIIDEQSSGVSTGGGTSNYALKRKRRREW